MRTVRAKTTSVVAVKSLACAFGTVYLVRAVLYIINVYLPNYSADCSCFRQVRSGSNANTKSKVFSSGSHFMHVIMKLA